MHRFAPLRNTFYRRWAAADFLSVIGTWMQSVAASWLVLDVTGSAARTGLVIASQAAPSLFVGPLVGRIADRGGFNTRVLLVTTQMMLALSTLAGAGAALLFARHQISGDALANGLLVMAFFNGAIHAIEGPNLGHLSLALIGQEQIPAALSLGALLSSSGRIIGTALAGLVAIIGVPMIFAFNALTFVAVGLTLSTIPVRVRGRISERTSKGAIGPKLWLLLASSVVLGGIGRNYQVTLSALSKERDFGVAGFAQASSLFAIGAALGGVAAVLLVQKRLRHFYALAAVAGVLEFSLGRITTLREVLILVLPIAVCGVLFDVTFASLFQGNSAPHIRGKVIALQGAGGAIGSIFGAPALGAMSQHFGAGDALQIAGTICLTVTLLSLLVMSRLSSKRVVVPAWTKPKMPSITSSLTMRNSEEPSNA